MEDPLVSAGRVPGRPALRGARRGVASWTFSKRTSPPLLTVDAFHGYRSRRRCLRIRWYLLVESLDGHHSVQHAVAEHGETLRADGPFSIEVDTRALLRRR